MLIILTLKTLIWQISPPALLYCDSGGGRRGPHLLLLCAHLATALSQQGIY
jgi:hypothetical protein